MKTYRIFIENMDPREFDDAEKVVINSYDPSLYDVRALATCIGTKAYELQYSQPLCMIGKAVEQCAERATLAKESFPIKILFKNHTMILTSPLEGEMFSIPFKGNGTIMKVIKTALP